MYETISPTATKKPRDAS